MKSLLASLFFLGAAWAGGDESLPDWAGRAPNGDPVRIAVAPPVNRRFEHLAWPKAVRTTDGTIVLGYLAGTHHGRESCPAVSISTDGGKTFSAPPKHLRPYHSPFSEARADPCHQGER